MNAAKNAIVTGGARRIGAAIVDDLAADGWSVAIHCHRSGSSARLKAEAIEKAGGRATVIEADLGTVEGAHALLPQAVEALGPIALLVNNAAIFGDDRHGALDPSALDHHLAVNLRAPLLAGEAFAAQNPAPGGRLIVNLIDQRVWKLNPYCVSYTISKSALWTATRTMAQAYAPHVRVNALGPGPTLSNAREGELGLDHEARGTLLGQTVDLRDFGRAIRFMWETESMTGQMIALDSGQHLAWRTPDLSGQDNVPNQGIELP